MSDGSLDGIAIIGMDGRFPGAGSIEEFWGNLLAGRDSVSFFSDAELRESGLDPERLRREGEYVPARGVLEGAECFDSGFFGIAPKEAETMDPQHRVFLEVCWSALERAGHAPGRVEGSVAIYAGATFNTYFQHALQPKTRLLELAGHDQIMVGNEKDYMATRVAYKLNLRGPAITLNTACSSSLVAVAHACQALATYQADMALAGGVSIMAPQKRGYFFQEGNISSPDGRTRSFDAKAAGTLFSNGVGVVVLRRLEDAVRDGDAVIAVIKGWGLNNDGSQRASFGAPGVEGQSEAIAMAQALAGVEPNSISYVEAHGTATPIGDPIEVEALTRAFRRATDRKQFCGLGSVKSNLGHLDAAAGVTGLIKTALSLQHEVIPASLHFERPNPKLDLENSPFYVVASRQEWKRVAGQPRRAGVSSFGTGGTNAHVVVEETPDGIFPDDGNPPRKSQLLMVSAKTPEALERATDQLAEFLDKLPEESLANAAYTLQAGRMEFAHRRVAAGESAHELAAALRQRDAKRSYSGAPGGRRKTVAFLFPGQGAQYAGMGRELYTSEPVFRGEVDRCCELLLPLLKEDLRLVLFPEAGGEEEAGARLTQTRLTQPALFVVEYALAALWRSWGVTPDLMIGHSVGEYVAACLSGVFSLEDATRIVARRAELVQQQPPGVMLAVRLAEKDVIELLPHDVWVATVNSPGLTVVAGAEASVAAFEKVLADRKVGSKRLHTSHAFHTPMMAPAVAPFLETLRGVTFHEPRIPWVSNLTGAVVTAAQATDPQYWADHVLRPVRFADGILEVMKGDRVLLEVGPGQTLATLSRQHAGKPSDVVVLSTFGQGRDFELRGAIEALGRLWLAGVEVDWKAFYSGQRLRRIPLPTYPFERRRCWPDAGEAGEGAVATSAALGHADACVGAGSCVGSGSAIAPVAAVVSGGPTPVGLSPIQPATMVQTSVAYTDDEWREEIDRRLRRAMGELTGMDFQSVNGETSFIELGLDSLLLTQASGLFRSEFGVRVHFRQLMEELSNLDAVRGYLFETMERPTRTVAVAVEAPREAGAANAPGAAMGGVSNLGIASGSEAAQLLSQQLAITQRLMGLLGAGGASGGGAPSAAGVLPAPAVKASVPREKSGGAGAAGAGGAPVAHGPFRRLDTSAATVSATQQKFLDDLTARYTAKTGRSKAHVQRYRSRLADPRTVAGFRPLWKEMIYPIVVERSRGSRMWDVDGNEYVDYSMGFGTNLLGHSPEFVLKALQEQLAKGIEVGPQNPKTGEVAELMCELTGMERCALCNTGSEAVLAAVRMARTATERELIVYFVGDYHGVFDEVLQRPAGAGFPQRLQPVAPGVPAQPSDKVMILEFDRPESLQRIRERGSEIAAVLVEPVQSRKPDYQAPEFLRELRELTRELDCALIFDEVITGFRAHQGGMQGYYGIRADIATYGKLIGGGMPIGAVCGSRRFMDTLDGGVWNFGDASVPEVGMTFFAGTYVRHPMAMAGAAAVLQHLKSEGPALQERLNERMAGVSQALNRFLEEHQIPMHLEHFCSFFWIRFEPKFLSATLLFILLRDKGIHIFDGRLFFLSTAHTDADIDLLIRTFKESVLELKAAGFMDNIARSPGIATASLPPRPVAPVPVSTMGRAAVGLGGDGFAAGKADGKTGVNGPRVIPTIESQQGMFLVTQMSPDANRAYTERLTFRLNGLLDREALKTAIQQLAERHEGLRTRMNVGGEDQTVMDRVDVPLEILDFTELKGESLEAAVQKVYLGSEGEVLDLVRGPLVMAKLVRLDVSAHLLMFTYHHLFGNGPSAGVLYEELTALYAAAIEKRSHDLPRPLQLSDYVAWWGQHVKSPAFEADRAYWRGVFSEGAPDLDLPSDFPRPAIRSYRGGRVTWIIGKEVTTGIRKLSGRLKGSIFQCLLATYAALLHRLSRQTDLVIGAPFEGEIRTLPGGDRLFANTTQLVPLRIKVAPEIRFSDLFARAKSAVFDSNEHQNYFFGRLIQELGLKPDPSRMPVVSTCLNYERATLLRQAGPLGFELLYENVPIANPRDVTKFDLNINVTERDGELRVDCDFSADLFEAATVKRWLAQWEKLMAEASANPDSEVGAIRILPDAERNWVLREWNNTAREYPSGALLHELVAAQAARTPREIAVEFEGREWSYEEFERRAGRLANFLRGQGVGPEVLVGVCMERSLEMVLALYGIMKAGGAYVPIDPEYPKDRVAFMLEDAAATILLTQAHLADKLPAHPGRTLCLDRDWAGVESAAEAPVKAVTSENLAYMIYTSGSTGRPKGALNTHRGICNRLFWMLENFQLGPGDIVIQKTPFSFDVSVWEFFWPLLSGARLLVTKPGGHRDPKYLVDLIRNRQVTASHFVPPMLRAFLQEPGVEACRSLRYVICSGEALPWDLQEDFFSKLPGELHNLYGPTEAAVEVTYWKCRRNDPRHLVPIGKPLANTQVYVLDERMEPTPIGVPGELHLGGVQVGRGYHRRPELSAEKFVPDTLGGRPGGTLYKTGDLCRWLPDGVVDYLGRMDHQVKVRGFRIELGEIEARLAEFGGVREAVVLARTDEGGEARLVAYLTRQSGPEGARVDVGMLRKHLLEKVPEFMVPSAFVWMERLPLSPNGKVDRKLLPKPETTESIPVAEQEPPRGNVETRIAEIWARVLGVSKPARNVSFFDLGGHSLKAMRLFAEIEKQFGQRLPLATLFQRSTIAALGELLGSKDENPELRYVVPIRAQGGRSPLFLFHAHGGEVLFYQDLASRLGADQPVYGIQAPGLAKPEARFGSIEELVSRYVKEIRQASPRGPYFLAGYCYGGTLAYEAAQQLTALGEPVAWVGLLECFRPDIEHFGAGTSERRRRIYEKIGEIGMHLGSLRMLGMAERWDYVRHRMRRMQELQQGGVMAIGNGRGPGESGGEEVGGTLERLADIRQNLAEAMGRYRPAAFEGHVTQFVSTTAAPGIVTAPDLGWRPLVRGHFSVECLPVPQGAIAVYPRSRVLAEALLRHLRNRQETVFGKAR